MKKPSTKANKVARSRQAGDKTRRKFPTGDPGKGKTHYGHEKCPPKKANVIRKGSA